MDRVIYNLKNFGTVKELAENGKIREALNKIVEIEKKLDKRERSALISIFANAAINYSAKIEWDDICHPLLLTKRGVRIYNHKCRTM
ncbi:MAG: hypothetical protein PHU17_01380 [Candidatus Pacebacteria bacterium]|nr:hypothetical protein [Candidatus Paceibacterota bacterium]